MSSVEEGTRHEPWQLSGMAVRERNGYAIWSQVPKSIYRIGGEAGLGLLSVGDDRRSCLLEAGDGVSKRIHVERVELLPCDATFAEFPDGFN